MTNEEAIECLSERVSIGKTCEQSCMVGFGVNIDTLDEAFDMAISALRQKDVRKNEPLTLDELRKMGGEPVFVVTDRLKEWCLVHSHNFDDVIGGGIIMTRRTAEKRTYQYACYGKTWLAYRQKPEEGTV